MNKHRLRMLQTALSLLHEEAGSLGFWVISELMPDPPEDVLLYLGNADTTALFTGLDDAIGIYLAARNEHAGREGMNLQALTLDHSLYTFLEVAEADERVEGPQRVQGTRGRTPGGEQ